MNGVKKNVKSTIARSLPVEAQNVGSITKYLQ